MLGISPFHRLSITTALTIFTSLLFTSGATAQTCDPATSIWVPEQSYTQGSVVFYDEHWYEARTLNVDAEPGITFDWRALNNVPECDREATEMRKKNAPEVATPTSGTNERPGTGTNSNGAESMSELCVTPEPWRFLYQYSADELATHGGKVWQAIHPTKGDMPGKVKPPSWQLVLDHCSMKINSSFGN